MKKIVAVVCLAFAGVAVSAYDIAAGMQINGAVKGVMRTEYSIVSKFGEYFRTPDSKFITVYDAAGHIVESSELTARDVLVNRIVNSYDAAGKLVGQTGFDSNKVEVWKSVILYKDGVRSECAEYGRNGVLKSRTLYTYADDGSFFDETYYDGDGAIVWKKICKFDGKKRVESEFEYFSDGSLDEERRYTYTDDGKNDTISYYDAAGKMTAKDVFRYDDAGVLVEVTTYNADDVVSLRKIVKYDTLGNLSKITAYSVSAKFGTTVNEMVDMTEYVYDYGMQTYFNAK
ncbi:MAG: hypothetical protein K2H09_10080 [Treponemataceae bacterium]|nr:hypothetical protein [Treponemataceae bacterium]